MKKLYSLPWGKYVRPWVVLLVILISSVRHTAAQNVIFNERMSQIYANDIIGDAEASNFFDEQSLTYSGTGIGGDRSVLGIPQNTAVGASNLDSEDGYIILGDLSNGIASSTSQERTFAIGDILGPINNPVLTFYLFISGTRSESVTATNGNVILEASTDGGLTYSTVSYTRVDGATSTTRPSWSAFTTSSLPVSSSLTLRFRKRTSATVLYAIDDVQLTGVRNNISVSATTLNFGNTNVNTRSEPQPIQIAGASLQNDIVVTAPEGFLVRKGTEAYAVSTTLPRNSSGVVENTTVDVIFAPTTAKTYSASLSVTSEGSPANSVTLNGTGITPPPATVVAPPSITFSGTTVVGQFSEPINFTVRGSSLISNVTVTPPAANYQIRLGATGAFTSNPISLAPTNGTLAETTLQVRFVPTTSGAKPSSIRVNATNAGEQAIAVNATADAAPTAPTVNAAPTDLAFGTASGSGSSITLTFDASGTNLTEDLVLIPSNSNIVIRDQAAGGDFRNTELRFAPVNGVVSTRTIEVRLVGPVASGSFNGSISVASGSALPKTVNVTASPVLEGNSTINTEGQLVQFEAVPGQPSPSQSYLITGTNLLQDVTVRAPNFFQISLTNDFSNLTSTGNTLVIPRNSGNDLTNTRIYVRYLPAAAQTNTNSILHTSNPALGVSFSVTGTSEPSLVLEQAYANRELVVINTRGTAQALTISGKRVNRDITLSLLQEGNLTNPNNALQFQLSLDNNTFSNTLVLTPNQTTRSLSQTIYVRYSPTYLGGQNGASAKLQFQSNDFSTSTAQDFPANGAVVGSSIDTRPTREATVTVTRSGTSAIVNFNLPANYAAQGYGEGRLIIASEQSSLNKMPLNGTPYVTGNQKYGEREFTPGYFVVYSGANAQAVIETLDASKTYYFYTFEYNNITTINGSETSVQTAENYLTPTVPDPVPGIVSPGTPLPVELKSFAAKLTARGVKLDWATASEKNNKGFEVQRSQDGEQFTVLQFVKGQGSKGSETVYSMLDAQPLSGTSYYRLKQVDEDGTFAYSPVAAITNTEAAREVSFYPNPAHDVLTISTSESLVGARVTVTDLTGRTLLTSKLDATNRISLSTLRTGTYLVTVETNSGKITRKVVKE